MRSEKATALQLSMKLSERQSKDLETVLYFLPSALSSVEITDQDIEDFFAFSDNGKRKPNQDAPKVQYTGYDALLEGKRWRGIHMHEMYEPGVLEGSMPYYEILTESTRLKGLRRFIAKLFGWDMYTIKPIPRSVVDFMKKEMFKGKDAELIERVYQQILHKDEYE